LKTKALGFRLTLFFGVIWIMGLALAFNSDHRGTVIGLIWVGTGIVALLIAIVFHFPQQRAWQIYDDGLFALVWGPIGLVVAFCRIYFVVKERRQIAT